MRSFSALGAAAAMLFAISWLPQQADAQVNPDGTYRHEIPIELPLVASGMVPKLAFVSSSQGGNGPLGAGWQLDGLPSISRTNYGEGIDYAGEDTYVGPSGRLVKAQANDTFFHGEQETFARFEPVGTCGDGPCTWTVRYPNGQVATFGGGSASAWASDNRGVRTWALASVVDPRGNSYSVTYSPADGEIYPWYVTYDVGALGASGSKFIWFDWEDRPDTNISYATGTKVRRSKRLKTLRLSQMSKVVTEWRLSYGVAPGTGASRLTTLSKVSGDGTMFERTWTFTYDLGRTQVYEQKQQHYTAMPYSGYRWTMDVNGDGFDDYVAGDNTECKLRVSLYNPASGFASPVTTSVGCHFGTFGYLWSGDFNGDGRGDIAFRAVGIGTNGVPQVLAQVRVYLGNTSGSFDSQLWGGTGWPWNIWGAAADTFTGDFDGDGKTDVATRNSSNNTWMVRRSTGSGFTINAWAGSATWGPAGARFVGDFDGDGRSDLASVVANPWRVIVLRSTGASFMPTVWAAGGQWNATRYTLVGDFNGDGKTDLVSRPTSTGAASLHLSTGRGLETYPVPTGMFVGSNRQAGDFDGDGRTDFFECPSNNTTLGYRVYSRGASFLRVPDSQGCEPSTETGAPLARLTADLDGDGISDAVSPWKTKIYTYRTVVPRDVLTDLRDGYPMTDPVVSVRYVPAAQTPTAIRVPDAQCGGGSGAVCGKASTGGRLLVQSLTHRDGRGGVYRTDYEFWNGRYIPGRPGVAANLGFQTMIARNAQTFVHTATHFLQVRPFHGQIEYSRSYMPDGDPIEDSPILFAETHNLGYAQYRCGETGCVAESNPAFTGPRQIRAAQVVTRTYEMGALLFEQRKNLVFDVYGNTAIVTSETWKDGARLHTQSESKAFVNRTTAPRAIGVPVSRRLWITSPADPHFYEEYYYDDLAWGQLGSYLEQTRVRTRRGGAAAPWEETQRAFDAHGNLVGETDARGLGNSYEYSPDGRLLVAFAGPEGRVSYTHDYKSGLPTVALHENGVRVVTGYDSLQRMISQRWEIAATGQLVREILYKGPSNGQWRSVCESVPATATMSGSSRLAASAISQPPPSGDVCTTIYSDALGREFLKLTPHASGKVAVTTIYGANAQPERVSEPYFQGQNPAAWTIYSYDVLGRTTRVDAPDGAFARVEYNPVAPAPGAVRTRTLIEPMGGRRTIHEDDRELPILIDDHGLVTRYAYDQLGRVITVQKNDGQVVAIGYDAMGNRDKVEDPNTGTSRFTFHTAPGLPSYGQLASETRPAPGSPDGSQLLTSTMTYDSWGRLAARTRSDGAVAAYVYDDSPGGAGRLVQESWDEGALHVEYRYQYDLLGRQVRREQSVSGALDDGTPVDLDVAFESSFNTRGRLAAITYPDGQQAVFGYDAVGDVTSVELDDAKVSIESRDVRGRAETIWYGNGLHRTDKSSPLDGKILERRVEDGSGAAVFWRTYSFDADGNSTEIEDLVDGTLSTEYDYDGAGRLEHATRADGRAFHYAHDSGGNLIKTTVFAPDGSTVERSRAVIAGTNRLAHDGDGHALTWSAAGHLLDDGRRSLAWSGDGQLTGVWQDGRLVESTAYDHASHRVATVQHLNDGGYIVSYDTGGLYQVRQRVKGQQILAQQTTANLFLGAERVAAIVYGDASLEPDAPAVPLGPRYFHADLLGSVSVVTDGGGTVTSRAVYSPTGELDPLRSSTGGERVLYTGGELGAGTGLVTLGVRHYDPALGVFVSPDATVPDPLSALDWNPYLYARGNPMRYTDPSGRFPFLLVGIGFAIGFIIGGTEGGILTDPGKWMDCSYLSENWSWGSAIVGGLVGAAAGYGYAALGAIPGSLFGVNAGVAAQSAAIGGAVETLSAYAGGERRAGRLAAHFGVGAFNGFMARTGFFGMASVGFRGAGTSIGRLGAAIVMYGGAMLCDSLVASGLRRTLDPDAPLEVSVFGVTYTKHADGVWTRRFSFAQAWRTVTGSILLAAGEGPSYLADFTPMHRDRIYQALDRKTENTGFAYAFATWAETGLLLYEMGWIRFGIPSAQEFVDMNKFFWGSYLASLVMVWGNVNSEFEERIVGCDYRTHEEDALYCRYP